MLKRTPSLLALPFVGIAAPAAAEAETEVMRLFRQWLILDKEERLAFEETNDEALFATSDCWALNIDAEVRLECRAQALALMAA